ncbi:DUF6600 domain-containing protein [Desulfatitalea alkaliphila]|uniref:FecR family protein n=1 Tax=Desulfatitalea alkaliphila TaxID=2929485 RepID=A0AA41R3W0_9BACT|nr:DUF6600 domain-containing protein [Desulfatitalea alkaliphila]MCJ8500545.1 hypothetical protein [Desulfatitalea alkaliphila]
MRPFKIISGTLCLWGALVLGAAAQTTLSTADNDALYYTPPRLSLLEGAVSYWRPGAEDWVAAQINTPLAPGDQLYVGNEGQMELQIGTEAYLRAAGDTQIGLEQQTPALQHFKVTSGEAALDLRRLEPGEQVALDTPRAALTIDQPGYYRLTVGADQTTIVVRNGGRAHAVLANGDTVPVTADEAATFAGPSSTAVTARAAPPLDAWDEWNHNRTDDHLQAESTQHLPPGTYGAAELDRHGTWRSVPVYGTVWVPRAVPADWAPYSSGTWVRDPYYGWTWVDSAPWGWAPFHYGRWVYVHNTWSWAPGPRVRRAIYAPAMVAFYGQPGVSVSVSVGGPMVGWVALGWGEPLVPWWGRPGFIHRPWWGGWGGPRVINNVTIQHTTIINARHITTYRNSRVRNAVVTVNPRHFSGRPIVRTQLSEADTRRLRPTHAAPSLSTRPSHFVPTTTRGIRPPEERLQRTVVRSRPLPGSGPAVTGRAPDQRRMDRPTAPRTIERATPRRPDATMPERRVTTDRTRSGSRITAPNPSSPTPPRSPAESGVRTAPRPGSRFGADGPSPGLRPSSPEMPRNPADMRQRRTTSSPRAPATPRSSGEGFRAPGEAGVTPPAGIRNAPQNEGRPSRPSMAPSRMAPTQPPADRSITTGERMAPRSGGTVRSQDRSGARDTAPFSGRRSR